MRRRKYLSMAIVSAITTTILSSCLALPVQQQQQQPQVAPPVVTAPKTQGGTIPVATTATGNNQDDSRKFATEGLSIPDLVQMNAPAVVTVAVRKIVNGGILGGGGYQKGVGTGFFIDAKGYIATNNHVVSGADQVVIILDDGTQAPGEVVWTNPENDLGLVRVDPSYVKGVVTIGNSDNVRVGEQVVAIGNPMSVEFAGTVTAGIVSAVNRKVQVQGNIFNYIQTDAAINGGNSGGPLFNSRGEVIAINSAKIAETAIEGISFAIPINVLMSFISNSAEAPVQSNQAVAIGVSVKDIPEALRAQYNVPEGIMVMEVVPGSAAAAAGIVAGDIITSFAGETVKTVVQLNAIKSNFKPGDTVKFKIYRDSEKALYEGEMTLKSASGN